MGSSQKMKCEIRGSVNMKLKCGKLVKLTKVLYVPPVVDFFLAYQGSCKSVSRWELLRIKLPLKIGVSILLDKSKGQNKIMMFYLKVKRYDSEGQGALTNLLGETK